MTNARKIKKQSNFLKSFQEVVWAHRQVSNDESETPYAYYPGVRNEVMNFMKEQGGSSIKSDKEFHKIFGMFTAAWSWGEYPQYSYSRAKGLDSNLRKKVTKCMMHGF